MTLQSLELGIQAVQAGQREEGARLLRIAVKSGELAPSLGAVAYLWLAETGDADSFKLDCYKNALALEPGNAEAQQRLTAVMASMLPSAKPAPTPPPTSMPEMSAAAAVMTPPARPVSRYRLASVIGGANGPGTAFFVSTEGLLATTRYVVGGLERVTVELEPSVQVPAQVVRSFSDADLALLQLSSVAGELFPITPYPRVPEEAPLIAVGYNGQQLRGRQRPTRRVMAQHWIPTDYRTLPDAGGAPLFDGQNYLLGMMTKNSSRSSGYLFGVHISAIRRLTELYLSEIGGARRAYCSNCGSASRAFAAGYFYCEVCGSLSPQARNFARTPQADPFAEVNPMRCSHCGAQVGFHNNRCLRCGRSPDEAPTG
jgi:hypothetical protein